MAQNQEKRKMVVMELHPNEAELIDQIRTRYRFGRVEVITKDGIPVAIEKTVERSSLSVRQ